MDNETFHSLFVVQNFTFLGPLCSLVVLRMPVVGVTWGVSLGVLSRVVVGGVLVSRLRRAGSVSAGSRHVGREVRDASATTTASADENWRRFSAETSGAGRRHGTTRPPTRCDTHARRIKMSRREARGQGRWPASVIPNMCASLFPCLVSQVIWGRPQTRTVAVVSQ